MIRDFLLCGDDPRSKLIRVPVMVFDLIPVILESTRIILTLVLPDHIEPVGYNLVGVFPYKLDKALQVAVAVASCFKRLSTSLCSKNIVHDISSFLCFFTTLLRMAATLCPLNNIA